MREGPPPVLRRLGRILIRACLPPARRCEADGDLIELWMHRQAAGRADLCRAYLRDLAGLAAAGLPRAIRRRISQGAAAGVFGMWQDISFAVRTLVNRPATSLAAILTLTVGLGSGAAIFTAVDRLLLRPIPFPDPERIVHVEHAPVRLAPGKQIDRSFLDLPVIAAAGTWASGGANLESGGVGIRVAAAVVDDGFFEVMGVAPLIGHPLSVPDGTSRHVVLSFDLWQRRFAQDRWIIGRELRLNDRDFIVRGVMPPDFTFPGRTEVWLPPMVDYQVTGTAYAPDVVARIAPNVSFADAAESVAAFGREHGRGGESRQTQITPLGRELTRQVRPTLWLLACCVALLLMVVCASVSNLLLARVATRHQELTVRRALGASRWRLARQLMIESILLAVPGAILGTAAAGWILHSLRAMAPVQLDDLGFTTIDPRLLLASAVLALMTALILGAAPGLAASGHDAAQIVRAGRGEVRSPFWRRIRSGLIVGQMAVALILLTASAAAVAALLDVSRVDPGFGNARSVAMTVTLPFNRFAKPATIPQFFDRAHERLAAVHGVRRVAATSIPPGSSETGIGLELTVPGRAAAPDQPRFYATFLPASPDYFQVMGIRIVAGRGFEPSDRVGSPPVIVLSETAVKGLFPDDPRPIGAHVGIAYPGPPGKSGAVSHEIIGIVADLRMRSLTVSNVRSLRQAYVPLHQRPPFGNLAIVVEMHGRPADRIEALRDAMREVDPSIPVFNAEPVDAAIDRYLASYRLAGVLVSAFAIVTLVVAAIGLYGLMAHLVIDRSREIGIRVALGADPRRLRTRLVGHGAMHAVAGSLFGVMGAYGALKLLGTVAPSFENPDPWLLALNGGVLLGIAVAATWLPASRVIGIDPVAAIRD